MTGYDYFWSDLTQKVIETEFALLSFMQSSHPTRLTGGCCCRSAAPAPIEEFKRHGSDFLVAGTVIQLVQGMNRIGGEPLIDGGRCSRCYRRATVRSRTRVKDTQVGFIRQHRQYRGDNIGRMAAPHNILDPANGPQIVVRLSILTREVSERQ